MQLLTKANKSARNKQEYKYNYLLCLCACLIACSVNCDHAMKQAYKPIHANKTNNNK